MMGEALERLVALAPIHVRAHRRWNPLHGGFVDIDEYWRDSLFDPGDTVELLSRVGQQRGQVLQIIAPDDPEPGIDMDRAAYRTEPLYRIRWNNRSESTHWESELGKVETGRFWGIPESERGIRVGWSSPGVVRLAEIMGDYSMFEEEYDVWSVEDAIIKEEPSPTP